jgi:hypothetical protein
MSDGFEAGVQIGDFRIERRLGAGGMGIVYLARQVSVDRVVALKILPSSGRCTGQRVPFSVSMASRVRLP